MEVNVGGIIGSIVLGNSSSDKEISSDVNTLVNSEEELD